MILIAEPVHFAEVHVQVNSAFVALYRHIFPGQQLQVYAEEQHIQTIRSRAGDRVADVDFTGFKAYGGRWYWPGKIWGEWRQILKVVRLARKQKPELLIWLCLFPTGNLLLQLLSRLLIPRQQQVVVLHGELEYLAPSAAAPKRSDRFLALVLRRALALASGRFRFIVLGTGIPARLSATGIRMKAPVYGIDHPFLYDEAPVAKPLQHAVPLRVCTFGTLKRSKNAHLFFELAGRFQKEIAAGQIRFSAIGKLFPDMAGCSREWVDCPGSGDFLPQAKYAELIAANDLALFFYDCDSYRLSASGALQEALQLGLPVWSLHNNYFEDLFSRYPAGLCLNQDEMERLLRRMLLHEVENPLQFWGHLITFFQENTFLLQAERLRSVAGTPVYG